MAISANVILLETHSYRSKSSLNVIKTKQLVFYRQADGSPEAIMPVLNVFLKWIKEGKLRGNLGQCGGWLTILGAIEYNNIPKFLYFKEKLGFSELNTIQMPKVWRCGSFEPAPAISGDIDFLYEIDINEAKLTVKKVSYINGGEQVFDSGQQARVHSPQQTYFDRFR
jgi:hypothetical protein